MQWCVYYADGSTFSDEDGAWEDAPLDGVQIVAVKHGSGAYYLQGSDHYAKLPDSAEDDLVRVDELGPYVRRYQRNIKHGVIAPTSVFEDCMRRSREDFGEEVILADALSNRISPETGDEIS